MAKVEWHSDILVERCRQAALDIARMTAETIKGVAVDRAPLEDGALRGSATVTEITDGAEISFSTPYAVVMHEWEGYTPSHAGTGPGYLRQPMLEAEDQYHKDVADAMKAIMA